MFIAFALLAITAIDLSGEWHGTLKTGAQMGDVTLDLKQNGETLSGTLSAPNLTFDITGIAAEQGSISFSAAVPMGGRLRPITFRGKLDGKQLQIKLDNVDFTLDRVDQPADAVRVERIGGLIRAWGSIKFFHPFLAYRPIDWDAALISAIPKVEVAKSADDYGEAVQSMLRQLNDPETRVLGETAIEMRAGGMQRRLIRCGLPPQTHDGKPIIGYYVDWETVDSSPPYVIDLPEGIRVLMRTGEPYSHDATILESGKTYADALPSREQRLLALAQYWNAIRYFYGYLDSIPSWDGVLSAAIRDFQSAQTVRDYVFAIARLASKTYDSHSWIVELWREEGRLPDIVVWPAQGQSVVKSVGLNEKVIAPGDVILAINGEGVEHRRQALLDIIPHSTPQAGLLAAAQFLLAGPEGDVHVRIGKPDNSEVEATVTRTVLPPPETRPVFEVLPSGFGYFDLNQLKNEEVDNAFDRVKESAGLILDMRGYPKGNRVPSRLTNSKVAAVAFTFRTWHGPDPALSTLRHEIQFVYPSGKPRYKGRVVVLINAQAISAAEHLCLQLEAAANPTFIGSPTRGADGEVTTLLLPGNIHANFSAMQARHADGRPLQRVGILPDIWVEPTIKGLREGRDEVLERAVEFLKSGY